MIYCIVCIEINIIYYKHKQEISEGHQLSSTIHISKQTKVILSTMYLKVALSSNIGQYKIKQEGHDGPGSPPESHSHM